VGMPRTADAVQVETLPYATRYLECDRGGEANQLCKKNRYNSTCWIPRRSSKDGDDVLVPPTKQLPSPGGQASWHPGNRV